MHTLTLTPSLESPSAKLRELADRLLRSCIRKPADINRWPEWKRGRRDLSFEMIDNALLAGGRREYARAIYLQKAAELIEDDGDLPPMPDVERLVVEADCASDRVRNLALLDGRITHDEARQIEETHTREQTVIGQLLERLRRRKG